MKIDEHSLRVFKCLHKSFYELERLKYNLRYDHTKVIFNTFYYGGYRHILDDFRKTVKKYGRLEPGSDSASDFLDNAPLSKQIKVRLKRKLGAITFGYRNKDGGIVIEKREAQIVKLAFSYFIRYKSIHKTLKKLASLGHQLTPGMLYKIVRDGFYAGLLKVRHTFQPIPDSVTPIIDTQIFLKALEIQRSALEKRENYNPYVRHESVYLLNRFITNSKTGTYYCGFRGKKVSAMEFNHYYRISSGKSVRSHFTKAVLEERFEHFLIGDTEKILETLTPEHLGIVHRTIEKSILRLKQSVALKLSRLHKESNGRDKKVLHELEGLDSILEFFSSENNFVSFALELINSIEALWLHADIALKREIQFTLFPYGIQLDQDKDKLISVLSIGESREGVVKRIESRKPLFH